MAQALKKHEFINYLYSLADSGKRGALADLRRGLSGQPGTVPALFPYVAAWVPEESRNTWSEKVYYLVATLFAYYQSGSAGAKNLRTEQGNLGQHCQALQLKEKQSGSFETRFINLINAHPDDLSPYLRQVISLLKSNEMPINWHQLMQDLLRWNSTARYVQKQWANSYWSYQAKDTNNPNQSES